MIKCKLRRIPIYATYSVYSGRDAYNEIVNAVIKWRRLLEPDDPKPYMNPEQVKLINSTLRKDTITAKVSIVSTLRSV